jgi:hypothetical protein
LDCRIQFDTCGGKCPDCKVKVAAIDKAAAEVAKREAEAAAERKALAIVRALWQTGHCLGSGSAQTAEDLEDAIDYGDPVEVPDYGD